MKHLIALCIPLYACGGAYVVIPSDPPDAAELVMEAAVYPDPAPLPRGIAHPYHDAGQDAAREAEAAAPDVIAVDAPPDIVCSPEPYPVPVTHDNGLGQHWLDCVPLGIYNQVQAMKACGAASGSCSTSYCSAVMETVVFAYGGPGCEVWGYGPALHGLVRAAPTCECPTSTDPVWQ